MQSKKKKENNNNNKQLEELHSTSIHCLLCRNVNAKHSFVKIFVRFKYYVALYHQVETFLNHLCYLQCFPTLMIHIHLYMYVLYILSNEYCLKSFLFMRKLFNKVVNCDAKNRNQTAISWI